MPCAAGQRRKLPESTPSPHTSLEAANTSLSLEDDEEVAIAFQLNLQDEILSECGSISNDSGDDIEAIDSEAVVETPPYAQT